MIVLSGRIGKKFMEGLEFKPSSVQFQNSRASTD
jgi:hypothetical protein